MKKILYIIFTALLVVACANLGSPDGGPYDEDPPRIVRTSPRFGASNTKSTKIVLEFNELVKIENVSENVIISPPQIEQPDIEAIGKKITIKLVDSIKPNTTYTIDFSDAIKDNNEGNSMGDYAFTFSSGGEIDTMQVSGYVLDASNLEPIKGIQVGVYAIEDSVADIHDSIFKTKPFERVSRTDASGHFVIKGLRNCEYRIYALNDQNQNFVYDQKSEMVAFSPIRFKSSSKQDLRADTVWHDSIHFDSINYKVYTHFYPDDLTLTAFLPAAQDRHLLKYERLVPNKFTFFFTSGSDTLPKIRGINFKADSAFVIESSLKNDTIHYWLRDSLIYNMDTLSFLVDYYDTDTTGMLALRSDTLHLVSKLTKAKIEKQKKEEWEEWAKEYRKKYKADMKAKELEEEQLAESADAESAEQPKSDSDENAEADINADNSEEQKESEPEEQTDKKDKANAKNKSGTKKSKKKSKINDEDIEVPPMPDEFMEFKLNPNSLDPDQNIDFVMPEPIDSIDMSKMKFFSKKDSLEVQEKFIFKQVEGKPLMYRLYAEWQPDSTYYLSCDTGMFVNIYGKRSAAATKSIKVGSMDSYTTLFVVLQNADTSAVVELLDGSDKVVKTIKSKNGKADFYFIQPGKYYMRMFYDHNGNEKWDTGDYDEQLQPEEMFYYSSPMELKAQWEITQTFDPTAVPLAKQKPLAITKQKDQKKDKSKKSKNQERLEMKKNGNKGNTNRSSGNAMSSMPRF